MSKEYPKISVVTITWGHEKFIEETMNSVFMQQYDGPIEFIIANDKSPDKTDEIIKNYLNSHHIPKNIEIRYTCHAENKGVMPNFIWAMEQVTGDYIAICEGDDYWIDPLKLQKQVDFLEANNDVVMCYHNRSICRFNGEIEEAPFKMFNNLKQNKIIESKDMIDVFMPFLTIMFRKDCINEYIKIDQMGVFGVDTFLRAFLSTKGKAAYLHFNGAVYRQHEGGIFSSLNDKIGKCKKAIQTRELILERIPNIYRKTVYKSLFKIYSVLFLNYLRSKKIGKAIKIIPSIVKYFFKFL